MPDMKFSKWLVTGASGLLGQPLVRDLLSRDAYVYALLRNHDLPFESKNLNLLKGDLTNFSDIKNTLKDHHPDVLVHTAGLTSVDQCERDPSLAYLINTEVPVYLAAWCLENNVKFVFISSDHITDGNTSCFAENIPPFPVNIYAKSKVDAEYKIATINSEALILRTNFFAKGSEWRKSLTDWLWEKAQRKEEIPAFNDSYFSPLSAHFLAQIIYDMVVGGHRGLYHAGGAERLSKYDFALAFLDYFNLDKSFLRSIKTVDAHLAAPRPADMSMNVSKIEGVLKYKMPKIIQSFQSIELDYRG